MVIRLTYTLYFHWKSVIVCPLPPLNNFLIALLLFLDTQKCNTSEKFLVLSATLNLKNNFRRKLSLLKLTSPANLTREKNKALQIAKLSKWESNYLKLSLISGYKKTPTKQQTNNHPVLKACWADWKH